MKFEEMNLDKKLLDGIRLLGFKEATPIQEKCIPQIKKGHDVVGQSLTGSGKTAAFGLPILEKIKPGEGIQALVLTPTRELCAQVRDHLEQMAKFLPINVISIYGGVGFFQQLEDIKIAEIVVATPGRLLDHMGRGNVKLGTVKFVILDEADKMFEMGFEEDVDRILRTTPKSRQTVMFSATMPRAAQNIIKKYLKSPIFVQEKLQVDKTLLKQVFYSVRREEKFSLLVHLLKQKTAGPAIVFCGTKRTVDNVASKLHRNGIEAMPVHGDLRQSRRQLAVNLFKAAKIDVLVATDVASRGLDIKDVSHVYNYDVPRTAEEYTHRIGRTARIGKKGDAVTLLSERDYDNFGKILKFGKMDIKQEAVPEFEMVEEKQQFHNKGPQRAQREFENRRSDYPLKRDFSRNQNRGGQQRNSWQTHSRDESRHGNFDVQSNMNSPRHEHAYERQRYHQQKYENQPRQGNNNNFGYGGQRPQRQNDNQDYSAPLNSPKSFGAERHAPSPWKEQKMEKEIARNQIYYHNEIKPGLDITPRTLEPLFPTSHYNPDHKRHKELLKKSTHTKSHHSKDAFGGGGENHKGFGKTGQRNFNKPKKNYHKRKTYG